METTTTQATREEARILRDALDRAAGRAVALYNARYNNALYCAATFPTDGVIATDEFIDHANALLDSALAVCGSPYHAMIAGPLTSAEVPFLELFL